ncbi:hypothetical protein HMPREF9946_04050 [Acetobacteraceae bacterium AT-5844]|nr:hypothetical protein HMPREF9946_04050 [Acetobacteraceae bacterium AT-5844]
MTPLIPLCGMPFGTIKTGKRPARSPDLTGSPDHPLHWFQSPPEHLDRSWDGMGYHGFCPGGKR